MPDGSITPTTPAGDLLSLFDSLEAALKRGGTGDALEALGVLDQLRAAHEPLVSEARDLGAGLSNAIALVNVAALALHYQCTDADGDVANLLDRCVMTELHGCRDTLEDIQRYAGGVRS